MMEGEDLQSGKLTQVVPARKMTPSMDFPNISRSVAPRWKPRRTNCGDAEDHCQSSTPEEYPRGKETRFTVNFLFEMMEQVCFPVF